MSNFLDCNIRRTIFINFENSPPLSKTASQGIVFCTSFWKSIKTPCGSFSMSIWNINKTTIDFDTSIDSTRSKVINISCSIFKWITSSLIIKNYSRNILFDIRSREKEFTISLSVGMCVFYFYTFESLSDSSSRLIKGTDTLSTCSNFFSSLDQLFFEIFRRVLHLRFNLRFPNRRFGYIHDNRCSIFLLNFFVISKRINKILKGIRLYGRLLFMNSIHKTKYEIRLNCNWIWCGIKLIRYIICRFQSKITKKISKTKTLILIISICKLILRLKLIWPYFTYYFNVRLLK